MGPAGRKNSTRANRPQREQKDRRRGTIDRQRSSPREKETCIHSETDRWTGIYSHKHLEGGDRQSGPVITRKHKLVDKQVDMARHNPTQRLGTNTPAQRDKRRNGSG